MREEKSLIYFFIGIQRGRLAPKVRSGEARFGLELDGGKAWQGRLPGALGVLGGGLWSCVCRAAREWEPAACHGWRSCGRC